MNVPKKVTFTGNALTKTTPNVLIAEKITERSQENARSGKK